MLLPMTVGRRYFICFSNWSPASTVVPLVFGDMATVYCAPLVLPVELFSFTAITAWWSVDLFWTMAT